MEQKEFEKKLNDLLQNRSEKAHKVMTNQFRNFFNEVMKLYTEYKGDEKSELLKEGK